MLRSPDWRNLRLPTSGQDFRYHVRDHFSGKETTYGRDAVAHLRYRHAIDGVNGMGLISAAGVAELMIDHEAQAYTQTLLSRMGVPDLIFMGKSMDNDIVTDEDIDALGKSLN